MTDFGRDPIISKLNAQSIHTFIYNMKFDTDPKSYLSDALDISALRNFTLLIKFTIASTPTDIEFRINLSDDDITYYTLKNGPFGSLKYVLAQGPLQEAVNGKFMAKYMKLYVLSTGGSAGRYFRATVSIVAGR